MIRVQRILVTGANGYIGSSLVRGLSSVDGYEVLGISRADCDLANPEQFKRWASSQKRFDMVVNCAASIENADYPDDPSIVSNNILIMYNLLSQTGLDKQLLFNRLIDIGSGAEYDRRYPIFRNSDIGLPIDMYGISKLMTSRMVSQHKSRYTNYVTCAQTLRVYGIFDEHESDSRFIKSCITNQLNGKPMEVFDNTTRMSFIYMPDFISIVKNFIDVEYLNVEKLPDVCGNPNVLPVWVDCAYEDDSDENTQLYRIAEYINSISATPVPIVYNDKYAPKFNNSYCGRMRTSAVMGSLPLIGLKEGIRLTYAAIMHNQLSGKSI